MAVINAYEKTGGFIGSGKKITVIGAGAIGLSWTALFLANGLEVIINDPREDIRDTALAGLKQISPSLATLGYDVTELTGKLSFEPDLKKAVSDVDFVQENGPENIEFKQALYVQLENFCKPGTLLFSSSSSIPASVFTRNMKNPANVLLGHPFNPPHLIPLVEVVPGERTSSDTVDKAIAFYKLIGKTPVLIEKEINGFVANRLQSALLRESIYLVREGVVSIDGLDNIVSSSIGLRWAAAGPFKTFTLGGGPGGLPHFLDHLGPMLEHIWPQLGTAALDPPTKELLVGQYNETYGKISYRDLEAERDSQQLAVMKALGK